MRLKKNIAIDYHKEDSWEIEKIEHVSKNTLFKVDSIVEYGCDLISLDSRKREARFLNSDMPEHFEVLASSLPTAKT